MIKGWDGSIELWGCSTPPSELSSFIRLAPTGRRLGCTGDSCRHNSHDGVAELFVLDPLPGVELELMDWWRDDAGHLVHAFRASGPGGSREFRVIHPEWFYARFD